MVLPPTGYLAMWAEIFGWHKSGDAAGISWVEASDAVKHPAITRITPAPPPTPLPTPPTRNYPGQSVNSDDAEKPCKTCMRVEGVQTWLPLTCYGTSFLSLHGPQFSRLYHGVNGKYFRARLWEMKGIWYIKCLTQRRSSIKVTGAPKGSQFLNLKGLFNESIISVGVWKRTFKPWNKRSLHFTTTV